MMPFHNNTARTTHRERKELFVTGHAGTSPLECLVVSASAPVGTFLFLELRRHPNLPPSQSSWRAQALFEAAVLLFPMAICQTEVTKAEGWWMGMATDAEVEDAAAMRAMTRTTTLLASELVLAFAIHLSRRRHHRRGVSRRRKERRRNVGISERNEDASSDHPKPETVVAMGKRKRPPAAAHMQVTLPFLTSYRATVSYLTFVAILAVDFRVFPRRYAKTEEGGCGLMDLGAASFVISGGFVSRHARRSLLLQSSTSSRARDVVGGGGAIRSSVARAVPLVILGIVRLVGNSGLDYQEHVSEYGVHWNFFFTLASVGFLSASARSAVGAVLAYSHARPRRVVLYSLALPAVVLTSYQLALSLLGWQEFVEDGPRRCTTTSSSSGGEQGEGASAGATIAVASLARYVPPWACDFFAANREGILGSIGYLALFWMSEEVASYCLWSPMAQGISRAQKQRDDNGDVCSPSLAASPGGDDGDGKCGDENLLPPYGGSPSDATDGGKLRRRHRADTRGDEDGGGFPPPPPRSDDDGNCSMVRATWASKESARARAGNTGISISRDASLMQGSRLLVCTMVLWCVVIVVLRLSSHDRDDNEQKDINYYHPISRRSTNAAFVLWSLSHNVTILLFTWAAFFTSSSPTGTDSAALDDEDGGDEDDWGLTSVPSPSPSPSPIFAAVNRNGLVVFLVANLLTGAVNLLVDTLETSDAESLAILAFYLSAVGCVALSLDRGLDATVKIG